MLQLFPNKSKFNKYILNVGLAKRLADYNFPSNIYAGGFFLPYSNWMKDRWFVALICAVDMFFYKFFKHPLAAVNVASSPARYIGCSAIVDLKKFIAQNRLGHFSELRSWLWSKKMRSQYDALTKIKEEFHMINSYMPYFMGFGLSDKSPYGGDDSQLYLFWHRTVQLCQMKRANMNQCRYLSLPANVQLKSIAMQASVFSFAYRIYKGDKQNILPDIPRRFNPTDWKRWYKTRTNDPLVKKILTKSWRSICDTPDTSIGSFLYELSEESIL